MESIINNAQEIAGYIIELIVIIVLVKQYVTKALKGKDVANILPKQNKLDLDVTERMEETRKIVGADRVQIYEFHNGEYGAYNRSICRFSCRYEVIKMGSRYLLNDCRDIHTAFMPKFIDEIYEEGHIYCNNVEEIKLKMPSTYAFKKNLGINAFYDIDLRNNKGQLIGFLAFQWDEPIRANKVVNINAITQLKGYVEAHLDRSK